MADGDDPFAAFEGDDVASPAGAGMDDPFGGADDAAPAADGGDDAFGLGDMDAAPAAEAAPAAAAAAPAAAASAGSSDPFAYVPPVNDENSALRKWEKERERVLKERNATLQQENDKLLKEAEKALKDFYAKRDARVTSTKESNRKEEKDKKATMTKVMATGHLWEKVGQMVDLKPPAQADSGAARVDRMRKLLIDLKGDKNAPQPVK